MENFVLTVKSENAKERIDKFLSGEFPEFSRSYIHKLIEKKLVLINKKDASKNYKLSENDVVEINIPEPEPTEVQAEEIPLDIVYEDNDLLIVNKPKDMVVHPAPGNTSGTLVNALLYHCKGSLSGINGVLRPGIVHRIDKDTSGLLIVAKNDNSHRLLAEQIKNHSFTREYQAIIIGRLKNQKGTIETHIGRHKTNRKKMAVVPPISGKQAITHYEALEELSGYSHIKLNLETGRTHQIRVHMAYLGHPVLGDEIYGSAKQNPFKFLKGQCLHAKKIGFIHPSTREYMEFDSELPEYFSKVLSILKQSQN